MGLDPSREAIGIVYNHGTVVRWSFLGLALESQIDVQLKGTEKFTFISRVGATVEEGIPIAVRAFRGPGGNQLAYRSDDFTHPWKEAPTAVLTHGFPRNSNFWYAWVPGLVDSYRVIRPDLRGLGRSQLPIEAFQNSIEFMVLDAISLLDHLRVEKAVWIGEATGAVIGMHLAVMVPHRLRALVVMSLPIELREERPPEHVADLRPGEAIIGQAGIDFMLSRGMREWGRVSVRHRPWLKEAPEDYAEWYLDEISRGDPKLCAAFHRAVVNLDLVDLISEITVPTLYLDGSRDSILLSRDRQLLEQSDHIQIQIIDGPGIDIGFARPRQCVDATRHFLESL